MKQIFLPGLLLLGSISLSAQIDLQLDLISDAFSAVVDITHAGDDRLFIVEQVGRIQIIQADGEVNASPFLDIDTKVGSGGERGLLGLAFHPSYDENGYFFVNYTNNDGNTVLARYQVSANDPELADSQSETILLTIIQPYDNHNGGALKFGPDGYLYISSGDGGDGGDPLDLGQDTSTPLGKILRIDVNNGPGTDPDYTLGDNYTVPASNPLADGPGGNLDEIWALGLRNPWRFSFDRLTGDMWIGDVGQGQLEEIDFEAAGSPGGLNYGWRCYEGSQAYNTTDCGPASSYTFPVYEYNHDLGCSINGGFVYRGTEYPLLQGLYLYSDYCSGRIWGLQEIDGEWVNDQLLMVPASQFVTMGEDAQGELYLGNLKGEVFQITDRSCPGNLAIDDMPISDDTYQANEMLTSSGTVENGSVVTFKAGQTILLKPGFQAQANITFRALIESCTPEANARLVIPSTEEQLSFYPALDLQIFPNPYRTETNIRYTLPETARVDIRIYDIYGQLVAQPLPAQQQEAGKYGLSFSAAELPAGIYLVVIRAGTKQQVGRMEVMR